MGKNVTTRRSTRGDSQNFHVSYGIQKWLVKRGFILEASGNKVDDAQYHQLLKEFAVHVKNDFDFSKAKHQSSLEKFVDRRFPTFCQYCVNKFKAETVK